MIWVNIILCGIITFLIRFIPLSGIMPRELPLKIKNTFKYIPLAVLTPIIFNGLSIFENNQYIPKRKEKPSTIKRRMDKFQKTTDYKIQDLQLI